MDMNAQCDTTPLQEARQRAKPQAATAGGELHAWSHCTHTYEPTEEFARVFNTNPACGSPTPRSGAPYDLEQKPIPSQALGFEKPYGEKREVDATVIQLHFSQKKILLYAVYTGTSVCTHRQ